MKPHRAKSGPASPQVALESWFHWLYVVFAYPSFVLIGFEWFRLVFVQSFPSFCKPAIRNMCDKQSAILIDWFSPDGSCCFELECAEILNEHRGRQNVSQKNTRQNLFTTHLRTDPSKSVLQFAAGPRTICGAYTNRVLGKKSSEN